MSLTHAQIRKVVRYGDPILTRPAVEVTQFDGSGRDALARLIDDMYCTMYGANGIGLAAPQVGVGLRVAIVDISFGRDPRARFTLVNPKILGVWGNDIADEGCLSLPGFRAKVARPGTVHVEYWNIFGERFERTGEGLLARALVHEVEHLHGLLYIHALSSLRRSSIVRKISKLRRHGQW